jgi:cell division protein FtsN
MLPEMEVAVKDVEIEHPVAEDQDSTTPASKPLEGSYLLQVGSFRKHEEADSLKASLALLGLEATIQTVSINGEQTWYRVRLGPFTERDALNQARKRLSENDFEAMVFKKRG